MSVCQSAVDVRPVFVGCGIEDDSTASGVAREDATRRPQNAVGRCGVGAIGDGGGSGESDNENGKSDATHSETSV
jgi:hypothetical protein